MREPHGPHRARPRKIIHIAAASHHLVSSSAHTVFLNELLHAFVNETISGTKGFSRVKVDAKHIMR
jgi:hypothetical protein